MENLINNPPENNIIKLLFGYSVKVVNLDVFKNIIQTQLIPFAGDAEYKIVILFWPF